MSQDIKVALTLAMIYLAVALIGMGLERWRPLATEEDEDA